MGPGRQRRSWFSLARKMTDLWEVRMLAYMGLQDLKTAILPSTTEAEPAKNEKAYAELVMLLDEKSLSMVMNEASDDGRQAGY